MLLATQIQQAWFVASDEDCLQFVQKVSKHLKINEHDLYTLLTNLDCLFQEDCSTCGGLTNRIFLKLGVCVWCARKGGAS